MKNLAYNLSLTVILATYLLFAYIAFLLFFPVTSFRVMRDPVPVEKKQYKAGDIMTITPTSCRFNSNEGEVTRIIRNVDDRTLAFGIAAIPLISLPNTCDTYNVSIPLPLNIPVGKYIIENKIIIKTNVLRNEKYSSTTEQFEIIK